MKYEIDQSNKIENTNKTTFVCLTNGKTTICTINANEKQELKLFFRELGKPLIFKLFTFSVLCAKALMAAKSGSVTIDYEYKNHERQIKLFILQIYRVEEKSSPDIWFGRIGKRSNAHIKAYAAMKKRIKGTNVSAAEVLKYYDKISKP